MIRDKSSQSEEFQRACRSPVVESRSSCFHNRRPRIKDNNWCVGRLLTLGVKSDDVSQFRSGNGAFPGETINKHLSIDKSEQVEA